MITYRISEIGHCPKQLSLSTAKIDGKVPSWLQNSADEGKWHEKRIKDEMKKAGYIIEDVDICPICLERLGEERNGLHVEITVNKPNDKESYMLIGHTDGKATHPEYTKGQTYGLEVKSMSQFEFDRWMKTDGKFKEFPSYAWQVSTYQHLTNEIPYIYVVKNRNIGGKDRFVIERPIISWAEIDEKMSRLTSWMNNNSEPYPAEFNPDSIECRRCKYALRCVPEPKILLPVEKEQLDLAVKDYWTAQELKKQVEDLEKESDEIFITHCKATMQNKWRYSGLSVSFSENNTRTTYPKENLLQIITEEQLKSVAKVGEPFPMIRITPLKEKS